MILSGLEIKEKQGSDIIIEPFVESRLNPNSYNVTLSKKLGIYTPNEYCLDMKKENKLHVFDIPEEGLVLMPGHLYIGQTNEYTETYNLVPMLEGRSSIGRLGMYIHVTAGFGDVGFKGYWTLEISVIEPLRVYPDVEIGQLFYHTISSNHRKYDSGKYQGNKGLEGSKLYADFNIS